MGSFAQGFRFAVTLILNMTLQQLGCAAGLKPERAQEALGQVAERCRTSGWTLPL